MSDEQGDRAGFQPSAIAGPVSWGYAPGWYRARLRRFRATAKAEADSATLRNDKQEGCGMKTRGLRNENKRAVE